MSAAETADCVLSAAAVDGCGAGVWLLEASWLPAVTTWAGVSKTAGAAFVVAVVVFSGAAFVVLPGAAVTVLSVVASAAVVSAAV